MANQSRAAKSQTAVIPMRKLFVSVVISGCLLGYAAMLYGLIHILIRINHDYLFSLAR
jgi:hypothetical protein